MLAIALLSSVTCGYAANFLSVFPVVIALLVCKFLWRDYIYYFLHCLFHLSQILAASLVNTVNINILV